MPAETDATEQVRAMLPDVNLTVINILEAAMSRTDQPPVGPGLRFPTQLEVGHQIIEGAIVFRIAVSVDRPDITTRVAVGVMYAVPDTNAFRDEAVVRTFGERIALPAAYPFARSKLFDLTVDSGVPPVVLDLIDLGRVNFGVSRPV